MFINQVQRLNPGAVDCLAAEELGKRLVRVPLNIQGNLVVWEHLRGLGRIFVPAGRRERNARLLDFDNWERTPTTSPTSSAFSTGSAASAAASFFSSTDCR